MVAALDRVPVSRIRREASQITPRGVVLALSRTLVTVLAGLLYAAGWSAARTVRAVWTGLVWILAAIKLGWKDGVSRGPIGRSD